MISNEGRSQLRRIYQILRNTPDPDDRFLLGIIGSAFHIGQLETTAEIVASVANLADSKASSATDGLGGFWAVGYLEAGNDLMELFAAKVDDLKERIAKADGITDLATLIDPDG